MRYDRLKNKAAMNKLEKVTADKLDMKRSPMSGAGPLYKGDLQDQDFLIDMKFTYSDTSISIKAADIKKIDSEAFLAGKIPVMLISINGLERYIISEDCFREYRNLLKQEERDGN